MAYSRRPSSRRRSSSARRVSSRSSYRSRSVRSSPRRYSGRSRSAGRSRAQTVRIELVTAQPSEVSRPASLMMKPAAPAKKAKF